MPNGRYIAKLVRAPSIGAITYQALALRDELLKFNDEEYPKETCQVRDVFLCIANHIVAELQEILGSSIIPGKREDFLRTRGIAGILHTVYSFVRYLRSSSPQHTPPGIQLALSSLTKTFFPNQNGKPICLVRPQWKYNLGCVPLSRELQKILKLGTLDPKNKLGVNQSKDILPVLWQKYASSSPTYLPNERCPNQLAILSFAGLDTHDVLLYPILAHELGHFFDYSFDPPKHLRSDLVLKQAHYDRCRLPLINF